MVFEFLPNSLARVRGREGFEVHYLDRFWINYVEGNRSVRVAIWSGQDPSGGMEVHLDPTDLATWATPVEGEQVPEEKRDEIARRIRSALKFMGVDTCVFDYDSRG